jgi:hypothetical protein
VLPRNLTTTLTALCPAGKRPLGGGWIITSTVTGNVNMTVVASQPNVAGTGWSITIFNNTNTDISATAIGTCMVSAN